MNHIVISRHWVECSNNDGTLYYATAFDLLSGTNRTACGKSELEASRQAKSYVALLLKNGAR